MRYRRFMVGRGIALLWALGSALSAQTIFTSAGLPASHRNEIDGKPALAARLSTVYGVLLDKTTGRLLLHDEALVSRLEPDGTLTALVGISRGSDGSIVNGTLASGLLVGILRGMAQDSAGALYLSDAAYGRVYRVGLDGIVTIFAGGGPAATTHPTPAVNATLGSPRGLAFDSHGNLDIASTYCSCIVQVTPAGDISTLFTLPPAPGFFQYFEGLATDSADNVYGVTYRGSQLWKIGSDGSGAVIAGTTPGFSGDGGPAMAAQLNGPTAVTIDSSGNLYVSDTLNQRVRKIATDGTISTIAGTGGTGATGSFGGDGGPAASARFSWPADLVFDGAGDLYVADYLNRRVRQITPDGIVNTVAGSGALSPGSTPAGGDGGPALDAHFNTLTSAVFNPSGDMYVADLSNNRVRKIAADGAVSTVAGGGSTGFNYTGDGGPATQATIIRPITLALDSAGAVYFDTGDDRVLKVTTDGIIHLVAGAGPGSGPVRSQGDGGPAIAAILNEPKGLAIDAKGNVYVGDTSNARLRKVDTNGIITTIAGPGIQGVDYWNAVAFDPQGNLYVTVTKSDIANKLFYSEVDRVNADGSLTLVAGSRQSCDHLQPGTFVSDGIPALQTQLCTIVGLTFDAQGAMYIPESFYGVLLRMGLDGVVTRVAGSPISTSDLGDGGSPLAASLSFGASTYYSPPSVAVDPSGNLFVPQSGANRIREIIPGTIAPKFSQTRVDFSSAGSQTVQTLTNIAEPLPYSIQISSNAPWLSANRVTGLTGDVLTLSAKTSGLAPGMYPGAVTLTVAANGATATLPVSLTVH